MADLLRLFWLQCDTMTLICIVDFRPCGKKNKISLGFAGRFTYAELLSVSISILVVWVWIMTGNAKIIMKPSQVYPHYLFYYFSIDSRMCRDIFWFQVIGCLWTPWEWGCAWHSLRLSACRVSKCRLSCWVAFSYTTCFGCSSPSMCSVPTSWSEWPPGLRTTRSEPSPGGEH